MLLRRNVLLTLVVILAMIIPTAALAENENGSGTNSDIAEVTVLHTNDFHGRLETDYKSRGGSAYMAAIINDVRSSIGEENVALIDAGDAFFAAPAISQLLMGESTIDIYNMMGYDLAAFGNHEFDKGQEVLTDRVNQSEFPWLGANVVLEGTDWDLPEWAEPYEILEHGEPTGVVELPVEWIRDDYVYFNMNRFSTLRPHTAPSAVLEIFKAEFDGAYREGGTFILTMHPHVIGHRSRITVLEDLVDYIKGHDGVWFATHEQVAGYCIANETTNQ